MKDKKRLAMIKDYQCSGCMLGSNPGTCESYKPKTDGASGFGCGSHVTGTNLGLGPLVVSRIALGLPTGFNKVGAVETDLQGARISNIRLFLELPTLWNHLNVPVWAMFKSGTVFVRTYTPRINLGFVDVIQNDTLSQKDVDHLKREYGTIDVGTFIDTID